ncbi:MAG: EcsC family protein [Clostridium sp.]|nr:EcsC family protein [Clostridium sp.]
MENEKKFNFKDMTKNAVAFSKQKYDEAKEFTSNVAVPKIKETALSTKESVSNAVSNVSNKVKTTITEEQMQEILSTLYIKSVDGIPKVSLPVDDLVEDYLSKNENVEQAVKSLINNSTVKCGTSGFLTSFGGFATMIATLPANITSVMYVQLRMCCAIAKMGGYDIHSDQVQTLIYACLTGSAATEILKSSGIKFANKFGVAMVDKIPGKALTAINRKVGFRFMTKFGETGIINLGKVVPVVGGFVGGGIDVASTRIIGKNAYNIFVKGEMPTKEEVEKTTIREAEYEELDDIDTKTLKKAISEETNTSQD